MRGAYNPLKNLDGTQASYNNCFKVNVKEIRSGVYYFRLKHRGELHQNLIRLVQDQLYCHLGCGNPADFAKYLAANWEVYIGNSENIYDNPRCPGGLQLKRTYDDVFSDSSNVGDKWVPAFGFSLECNMLGEWTHFVAYTLPTESVTICDAAVMGTYYIRDEPLAETVEVKAGSSITLSVPHVHALDTIGNVLAIDLRMSKDSEFTFVQLTNGATATKVFIDAADLTVGITYSLKLESFDTNGEVYSTLKIDTVTVVVVAALGVQTITPGKKSEWSIAPVLEQFDNVKGVYIMADPLIARYVTLLNKSQLISYDGSLIEGITKSQMVKIVITIVTATETTSIDQLLFVHASTNTSKDEDGEGERESAEPPSTVESNLDTVDADDSSSAQSAESYSVSEQALIDILLQQKNKQENESPTAPIITIREISDTGKVVFAFSEDMWVIPSNELKLIKSSNVTDLSGVTRPLLDITVVPYDDDDEALEDKLGFTWEPIEMTKRKLEV